MLGTLGVSFLCSLLESVLMSTPLSFITMKKEQGYKPAEKFFKFKSDPDRPLAAILSLNTIANTLGAAAVGRQATILFGSTWFGIISALTTLLVLVFSEIVPKTIGTTYWKNLMGFVTSVISFLTILMWPLVIIVQLITNLLSKDEDEAGVRPEDIKFESCKSSGAGGQHINKTESAVRLTHKPTGIVIECDQERSQLQNKEKALTLLRTRLYDMRVREQEKMTASQRRSQIGSGDRSEKIRTYNYPQSRVTDHRINKTIYTLQSFMNGDIGEMISELIAADSAEKLKNELDENRSR